MPLKSYLYSDFHNTRRFKAALQKMMMLMFIILFIQLLQEPRNELYKKQNVSRVQREASSALINDPSLTIQRADKDGYEYFYIHRDDKRDVMMRHLIRFRVLYIYSHKYISRGRFGCTLLTVMTAEHHHNKVDLTTLVLTKS